MAHTLARPDRARGAVYAFAAGCLALAACSDAPPATAPPAAPAQPQPSAPIVAQEPARPAGPRLEFAQPVHDFGRTSDVGSLKHAFEFKNTGDERLVITDIKASCGCTATTLDKKVFEPGEGDAIGIEWHPKGVGKQRKSITVQSNSRGEPLLILDIDAEIEPLVSFEPSLVNFGRVRIGEQHVLRTKVVCADPDLVVESVSSQSPHFVGQVVKGPDGALEVEVLLRPTAPWGQVYTALQVKVVGRPTPDVEPTAHEATLSASARVFGDIETEPAMFGVGRVDPGASFRYEVKVLRTGSEPFQIVDAQLVEALPTSMRVRSEPLQPAEGNGHKLVLEGEAGDHLGAIRAQVRFLTDVPGEGERSLPVMGIVRALDAEGH